MPDPANCTTMAEIRAEIDRLDEALVRLFAERATFIDRAAEISQARLIRSPLEPWTTWFAACGLDLPEPAHGAQFNDVGLAYDAAASGFGVVLLKLKLGAAWLDSGRLVRLSSRTVASAYRHYICWQPGALERWECAAFADWLTESLARPG